jgi:hypothetical protein
MAGSKFCFFDKFIQCFLIFYENSAAAPVKICFCGIKNPPGEGLPGGKRRYNGNCFPLP